jgi:hypothetical protein
MKRTLATVAILLTLTAFAGAACFDFNASEVLSETRYKVNIGTNAAESSGVAQEVAEGYESVDLSDDEWCNSMKENCAEMRELCNEAREIDPPESMEENHAKYLEAVEHFEASVDLLEAGINEADEHKIAQSEAEMNEATETMEEFVEMMDEPWVEELEDEYQDAQED